MLLGVVSGFGIGGVPLVIFSYLLAIIASMVQAVVFCLLTTVYFALVLTHDELEQSAH
jgi:F0F1-type ATP synthase membrane subunit a